MGRMLKIASLIILITVIAGTGYYYTNKNTRMITSKERGILIISTFPSLVDDIKLVACENETVKAIVPKGVDPHEYQLTPEDADLLKRATIIVSTAHAPFEMKIRNLVEENETKAILLEIPKIPGIKILKNPVTGKPNYHMPIMDPRNYIVFMKELVSTLNKVNPRCTSIHEQKLHELSIEMGELLKFREEYNMTIIASDPTIQYEVSWLGLKVKYLFIVEHNTPASFDELNKISQAIRNGEVHCIIASTSTSMQLQNLINEIKIENNKIKIIYIPGPLANGTIPSKLNETVRSIRICSK